MSKQKHWRLLIVTALVAILLGGFLMGIERNRNGFAEENTNLASAILAGDHEAISKALGRGANVNAQGSNGVTPLMLAVDRRNRDAVTALLSHGADPNLQAADGHSAVSLAVENYRQAADIFFAVMRAGGNPNMRGPDGDPVIMTFLNDRNCEYIGHMKSLGADLDITTRGGDPIILDVGTAADWDVVWCLIELGAKYDYEKSSPVPLSRSLLISSPAVDSPIYPYKKKVWHFLHDHGIKLQPLK